MNIPRTRPLARYSTSFPQNRRAPLSPDGTYTPGIQNQRIASQVGYIISFLPHVEERMIDVMALLLGGKGAPAKQVFRTLTSEDARVKVMRSLLEKAEHNQTKGQEFDDLIDLFIEIKKRRNTYAHGLWWTHQETDRVFIEEPSDSISTTFFSRREIQDHELKQTLERLSIFFSKSLGIIHPDTFDLDGKLRPSPDKHPEQPETEQK